ncbi:dipeptidase [Pareuzebyella sediminis]|uniref:dipeptidase n=1 Tax=Pareuzebyella sediminis TaxID=2607998 RepID=UPI0011EFA789|nr:dipeptidase [Pareuzebyella sediminis]
MKQLVYLIGLLAIISCKENLSKPDVSPEKTARQIHEEIITIDTHNDIDISNFTDSINYKQRLETQVNLPKMKEGGLDVTWLIVYTGQDSLTPYGYTQAEENAMSKFAAIHRLCEDIAPNEITLALNSDDVRRIDEKGQKIAMIGVENAYPMGLDLSNFEKYHALGARYISLAHNGHSQFCDSHTGEQEGFLYNGLSDLGKSAVLEMNRLGIMIDVSHISRDAMLQIISLSSAPIIASHSSARGLCNHSRNLDDEQLKALKKNGGVVQTVAFGGYLNTKKDSLRTSYTKSIYEHVADSLGVNWYDIEDFNSLTRQEQQEFEKNYSKVKVIAEEMASKRKDAPEPVGVTDLIDHVDYMVNLIGIDHVGISSDFDGGGGIAGWSDASETFNVTQELLHRGYTEEEIAKLWGGNLLRVLDEVQALAKK